MLDSQTTAPRQDQAQFVAAAIAVIGIVLSVIGATSDLDHFLRLYLIVFLFFLQLALGSLGLLLVSNLVQSRWANAINRITAAGARTLPLMAVLFVPIVLAMGRLYPWVNDAEQQTVWLNPTFFVVRAVVYWIIWIVLAYSLSNWSYRLRQEPELLPRLLRYSVLGLVLFFITSSLAAVDWIMSLTPGWVSTVYGWLEMARQGLAAMAFIVLVLVYLSDRPAVARFLTERVRVDLGALLLVGLLAWAYLAYMQYVIIWSANIAAKVIWYEPRVTGTWQTYIVVVVLLHAVALVLLLAPGFKRNLWRLGGIAALLLVLRLADLFWEVLPAFPAADTAFRWWAGAVPLAGVGLWLAVFFWSLSSQSLLPDHEGALSRPALVGEPAPTAPKLER